MSGQVEPSKGELVRSAKDHQSKPPKNPGGGEANRPSRVVGDALRQAYDEALQETIPDDLLDLLKKLD
jgi:Anti-sigma factor NepR